MKSRMKTFDHTHNNGTKLDMVFKISYTALLVTAIVIFLAVLLQSYLW